MNPEEMVTLTLVGSIAAWLFGFILFTLFWYWLIRLAVTAALRTIEEEKRLREKRQHQAQMRG